MSECDRSIYKHDGGDYFYTDLKVMKSHAGWYLGRLCWDKKHGYPEPLSRESDYFDTREGAERALAAGFEVRQCAENEHAYQSGALPAPHQPEHN